MAIEIIFNNQIMNDNEAALSVIKKRVNDKAAFSGSIEAGNVFFLFKNVKPDSIEYYINEFNNLKSENKEVKFVIQTHDAETGSL